MITPRYEVEIKRVRTDRRTANIIQRLLSEYYNGNLSSVDKGVLQSLLDGDINYEWIVNERQKCANDPLYFISNYAYVPNNYDPSSLSTLPDRIKNNVYGDIVKFVPYEVQVDFIKSIINNDKVIAVKSRQVGFTASVCLLSLWLTLFQNNKRVLIFSKTFNDAKRTMREYIKFPYENLPFFLKRKILKNNESEFALGSVDNASFIYAKTSSKKSGRSISATWLILDEAEFIDGVEELWTSSAPTLFSTRGKAVILSTPYMYNSWFYRMVEHSKNSNEWILMYGHWSKFPDRDEQWYMKQCEILGHDRRKIKTELDMEWILPMDNYYPDRILREIKPIEPTGRLFGWLDVYNDMPENKTYIIGIDPYTGGVDNNAVCIMDLDGNIHALSRTKNEYIIDDITQLLDKYDMYIAIERNMGYKFIRDFVDSGYKDRVLYHCGIDKSGNIKVDNKYGVFMDRSLKKYILDNLGSYMHGRGIPIVLYEEIKQLVIKNDKIYGLSGDDTVMATAICLWYVDVINRGIIRLKRNVNNNKDSGMWKYAIIGYERYGRDD